MRNFPYCSSRCLKLCTLRRWLRINPKLNDDTATWAIEKSKQATSRDLSHVIYLTLFNAIADCRVRVIVITKESRGGRRTLVWLFRIKHASVIIFLFILILYVYTVRVYIDFSTIWPSQIQIVIKKVDE